MTALCMASMLLSAMATTAPSLMLPVLAGRLGVGVSASGTVFTASFLGFVAFALPGGALSDRFGKKNVMTVSLAGLAATSALIPLAGSFPLLVAVIFLNGGFNGMVQVLANSVQADLHSERSAYYININGAFFGAGAVLMPLAAGAVSRVADASLVLFLLVTAVSLALCACVAASARQQQSARMSLSLQDLKKLAGDRRLWLLCACLFLYCGTEVSTWGWMSTFLKQKLGFSISMSGAAVSVFWAGMSLGRFAGGRLTGRFRAPALAVIYCAAALVSVVLCGVVSSAQAYWAVIALTGLSFSGIYPLLLAFGAEKVQPASSRTAAYALLICVGNLGVTMIPWLTGVVSDKAGLQAAMIGPSVLFVFVAAIVLMVDRLDRKAIDRI